MGHAWDTEDAFPHTFLFYSCISELGMKSGAIPDSAITGSASQQGYGPEHARIDNPQGWYTPERQSSGDWLQIDTGSVHYITKIATQVNISIQEALNREIVMPAKSDIDVMFCFQLFSKLLP